MRDPETRKELSDLHEVRRALEDDLRETRDRSRRAAQLIIKAVGADGPTNVDEAAQRIVSRLDRLRKAARKLRKLVQHGASCSFCGADMASSLAAGSRAFVHFHGCPVVAVDVALGDV